MLEAFSKFLGGTRLAFILFGAIVLITIPGTFLDSGRSLYAGLPFKLLLAILGLNLLVCSIQRWKRLQFPVLMLHTGVLVVLSGSLLTSFGSVSTVNIYEGGKAGQVFNWDMKKDVPLGFDLVVEKIHREYRPILVQVGVLYGNDHLGPFTLKTGESFEIGDYRVQVDSLEISEQLLHLTIYQAGRVIGAVTTSEKSVMPAGFPYEFRLVAFKNPVLQRTWIDLKLLHDSALLAEGSTEINSPFQWGGMYFYNTLIDRTPNGEAFAGIQIVRDPGRAVVCAGFALAGIGALALLVQRLQASG